MVQLMMYLLLKNSFIIKIYILILFIFNAKSSNSQAIYEFNQTFKYLKDVTNKRLNGTNKIYLIYNENNELNWVDCNISDSCIVLDSFKYKLQDSIIHFFNLSDNSIKFESYPQFSLKGDTMDYIDEDQIYGYPNVMGKSIFLKDTLIRKSNMVFDCFKFVVFSYNNMDNLRGTPFYKEIYIDKNRLIPIIINSTYYDHNNKTIKSTKRISLNKGGKFPKIIKAIKLNDKNK